MVVFLNEREKWNSNFRGQFKKVPLKDTLKIQVALTGFKPMTSVMPGQCSKFFFFLKFPTITFIQHKEHSLQITYFTYSTALTLLTIRYLSYLQNSIYTTYNTQYTKH